jgi:hypothetical protein
MDKAKAKEIFSDAVFVTSLLKLETAEEAQKALKARGLEVSLDEIKAIGAVLEKAAENGDKLSEADLGNVAGGGELLDILGPVMDKGIHDGVDLDDGPWGSGCQYKTLGGKPAGPFQLPW